MSIHVMSWVLRHSDESVSGRRLTLLALAEFAHDDGTKAYPTVATMVERTRLSERQVHYCLKALIESGAIEKTGVSPKGVNVYRIVMRGGANTAPGGVQSATRGGAMDCTRSVEGPRDKKPLAAPAAPRAADEVWDVLEEIFGTVTNANARGRRNKVVKLLKESTATVDEIRKRSRRYKQTYPGAAFTDMALANQWDNLAEVERKLIRPTVCAECGLSAPYHVEDCPQAEREAA